MTEKQPRRGSRLRHRRWRRLIVMVILLPLLLASVGLFVATRSWFLIDRIEPRLAEKLGGDVSIREISYRGDGWFGLSDLILRTPDVDGVAGEIGRIDRASVRIDLSKVLTGQVMIEEFLCETLFVRLSEDVTAPGRFSFMTLNPQPASDDDPAPPPRISLETVEIEVGQYDRRGYERVGQQQFSGSMMPSPENPDWYSFVLTLPEGKAEEDHLVARGRWNHRTLEHHVSFAGLNLDERMAPMLPLAVRRLWEQTSFEGDINQLEADWSRGRPYSLRFDIKDVALTLPIETVHVWASFRNGQVEPATGQPRMQVSTGEVALIGDTLSGTFEGKLIGAEKSRDTIAVPWEIDVTIGDLANFQWANRQDIFQEVLRSAPFEVVLRMEDFHLPTRQTPPPAIEMPRVLAEGLARFDLTSWTLDTEIAFSRVRDSGDPAAILTEGIALIRDGAGAYFRFPYRLENVQADISFDNEEVLVHSFTGNGAAGAKVSIDGSIKSPGPHAAVDLAISGRKVPLDQQLQHALRGGASKAFQALLNRPAYESLECAGLLNGIDDVEAAREQRDQLQQQLRDPDLLSGQRENLQTQLARLDRVIAAGPFELGGLVDFQLRVNRPPGEDKDATTTGIITPHSQSTLGVLYEKFPYPLTVFDGGLRLIEDAVILESSENTPAQTGWTFTTPTGGTGVISGRVDFPKIDGDRDVRPNLHVEVVDDQLSDPLLAAIPLRDEERNEDENSTWPGETQAPIARFIQQIGAQAQLDYSGTISTDQSRDTQYTFNIEVDDGALIASGSTNAYDWPAALTLRDVEGRVHLTRDQVTVNRLTGSHAGGKIVVESQTNLAVEAVRTDLTVDLTDVPIERYFLDFASPELAGNLRTVWREYQPRGRFGASISAKLIESDIDQYQMQLQPQTVSLSMDDQPITLRHYDGTIVLEDTEATLDGLSMWVAGENGSESALTLDGSLGGDSSNWTIAGEWIGGQFESPVIDRLLNTRSDRLQRRFKAITPTGEFDATFTFRSDKDDVDYEIILNPYTLAATVNKTRIETTLSDQATVRITPGWLMLENFGGSYAGGGFDITGTIDIGDVVSAYLIISTSSQTISPELLAFLPQPLHRGLAALDASIRESLRLQECTLHLHGTSTAQEQMQWQNEFEGPIDIRGGSFVAGVGFAEFDGRLNITARGGAGAEPSWRIGIDADHVLSAGRTLADAGATVELGEDGASIEVNDLTGSLSGGRVSAQATVGLGVNTAYDVAVNMVEVELGEFIEGEDHNSEIETTSASQSTGDLNAELTIAGLRNDPQSRRGRGALSVSQGRMASMPVMVRLLQAAQFMLPLASSFTEAEAEYFISGRRMIFEQVQLVCPTLRLHGRGEMNLESFELDLTFQSRGTVSLLSDLVGMVSDQLFEIKVTGPLNDPEVGIKTLPGIGAEAN